MHPTSTVKVRALPGDLPDSLHYDLSLAGQLRRHDHRRRPGRARGRHDPGGPGRGHRPCPGAARRGGRCRRGGRRRRGRGGRRDPRGCRGSARRGLRRVDRGVRVGRPAGRPSARERRPSAVAYTIGRTSRSPSRRQRVQPGQQVRLEPRPERPARALANRSSSSNRVRNAEVSLRRELVDQRVRARRARRRTRRGGAGRPRRPGDARSSCPPPDSRGLEPHRDQRVVVGVVRGEGGVGPEPGHVGEAPARAEARAASRAAPGTAMGRAAARTRDTTTSNAPSSNGSRSAYPCSKRTRPTLLLRQRRGLARRDPPASPPRRRGHPPRRPATWPPRPPRARPCRSRRRGCDRVPGARIGLELVEQRAGSRRDARATTRLRSRRRSGRSGPPGRSWPHGAMTDSCPSAPAARSAGRWHRATASGRCCEW